jgi:hypothetical protein
MPTLKLPRREQFAQNVAKSPKTGSSLAECYVKAGYAARNHSAEQLGSQLLKNIEVRNRVDEILRPAVAKTRVTVESLIAELETTIGDARAAKQHTVVVNALGLSAKLVGLLRDKIEVGAPGAFDQATTVEDVARAWLDEHDGDLASVLETLDVMRDLAIKAAGDRAVLLPAHD